MLLPPEFEASNSYIELLHTLAPIFRPTNAPTASDDLYTSVWVDFTRTLLRDFTRLIRRLADSYACDGSTASVLNECWAHIFAILAGVDDLKRLLGLGTTTNQSYILGRMRSMSTVELCLVHVIVLATGVTRRSDAFAGAGSAGIRILDRDLESVLVDALKRLPRIIEALQVCRIRAGRFFAADDAQIESSRLSDLYHALDMMVKVILADEEQTLPVLRSFTGADQPS